MIKHAIEHTPVSKYIYATSRSSIIIRIRVARSNIKECKLIYWPRDIENKKFRNCLYMKCKNRDDYFDYYEIEISFPKVARYMKYYFELTSNDLETVYVSAHGINEVEPKDGYFDYLYTNENDVIKLPEWAKGQVFYHIFPERFYNGHIDKNHRKYVPWGSKPTRDNYMGGDLKGIIEKIDYIMELGVDCIFLNPIFEADFNHKYATINYFNVDPDFGTNEDLIKLVHECHKRNIKIVLDGVFNHIGVNSMQFKDVLEKQENSKYKDWFYITRFPVDISHHNYECVGAYKWMPKLRTSNPEVQKFILNVMEYWIVEAEIDGWRLDVADEVDYTVWQEARERLKRRFPDIILLGETWGNASMLLQGNQLDIAMNYVFRDAVKDFFVNNIKPSEFDARLNRMLAEYYNEVNEAMYNLIDSHDTKRFLRECNENKRIFKLAVAFQILFCGSPAIYYGDEVGMTGDNDPDCRGAMIWDETKQDKDILEWYKRIIRIRKDNISVKRGDFYTIVCDDILNLFGFIRSEENEDVYVIINRSNYKINTYVPLRNGEHFEDLLNCEILNSVPLEKDDKFYNQDLLEYSRKLAIQLNEYSIKILKKRMEEFV